MEPAVGAATSVIASLRGFLPLEEALGRACEAARQALSADGVAISIRRDGRHVRGRSGALARRVRAVPLQDGEVNGTLRVAGEIAESDVRAIAALIEVALAARFLGESAQFDGLTGVLNRRAFDARVAEEWQRSARNGASIAIAMIDVDYFKAYNDRRGHQAGDDVLRRVAQAAAASLQRAGDRFARYGGEEFAVVLPETDVAGAIEASERVRAAIRALAIPHPLGKAGRVTVSIGVATSSASAGGSALALIEQADRELYRAKAGGRDRVVAGAYVSETEAADVVAQALTTLVGRDGELAAVDAALGEHAFVTITGTVGLGKTRLALMVAERAARFAQVRFVDVIGTLERADVVGGIRAALETDEETLVVVDGCEQVTQACREAFEGIGSHVRVLSTSRVPLEIDGEFVVRLQPLDDRAARELFVDRASSAGAVIDPSDATLSRLLRRLGGVPLAIELAAARLQTASMEEVFAAVGSIAGDEERRRRSLPAMLAGAVAALDPARATMLAAVSAFAGPFAAADAAAVVPIEGLDDRRSSALLASLARAALLHGTSHDGVTRWRTIGPVREAALVPAGAMETARHAALAHLRWCRERVAEADASYGTVENQAFLQAIAPLSIEFSTALDRAPRDERMLADGMALCVAAIRYWFAAGKLAEARARCDAFLDLAEGQDELMHVKLLTHAMRLAFAGDDLAAMERYAREAENILGPHDRQERATVMNYLGVAAKFRGEYDDAEARFSECRAISTRIGYRRGQAVAVGALGTIAADVRLDFARGAELFKESAALFSEIKDDLNAAIMTGNAAYALAYGGDAPSAREYARRAAEEARKYGYTAALVHALDTLALAELRSENPAAAAAALREAFAVLDPHRDYNQSMAYAQSAAVASAFGRHEAAARLLGAAEAADARRGTPVEPLERMRREPAECAARERLGEARYETLFNEGKALPDQDVIALASFMLEQVAGAPA